ncbi:TerB N-terminal domain-containing protein [Paenibacillus sp. FSL R7-0331]|uniref:TerB N-terminal domain-containing protein n=1 Tax=Paenibacillus sp. FSL R7-0331 TaxID=1536773 RepID=UPI000694CC12|nr:TerB N-terminal domain-containing protein [Paenibacillus sp. FSL R7-0331]
MPKDKQGLHFSELVWESSEQNMAVPPRGSGDSLNSGEVNSKTDKSGQSDEAAPQQLQLWDLEQGSPSASAERSVQKADQPKEWNIPPKEPRMKSAPPLPRTAPAASTAKKETESEFVQQAAELEDMTADEAKLVPFKSYWPSYSHMTAEQSRWYFYWRNEVRQGRFPKTDLSYIFLHVYELINGIGWREPEEGYRQLGLIWEAYRSQYKRLDQYLGSWMADFSFVHKLDVPLSLIVARTRGLSGDLAEIELLRCLTSTPEQLTFEVLTVMSDYDISKSKFYAGEGKEAAERYIPQVVALIDAYVARKHGARLIEKFPPGPPVMRERYLFRSAVYDISRYGYSVLVPVVRISKLLPLRSLITRLFRLTENKLRELTGFRGRLKDIRIDPDMDELITKYLQREFRKAEQEAKGPAVVIDQSKLEQLKSDSEVVRSLLTVEAYDEPLTEQAYEPEQNLIEEENSPEQDYGQLIEVNTAADGETPAVQLSDGVPPEWAELNGELLPLHRKVLLALAADNGSSQVNRIAAAAGTMPELVYDEINELAVNILGDLLIDGEELAEEWKPMLYLFNEVND